MEKARKAGFHLGAILKNGHDRNKAAQAFYMAIAAMR